MRQPHKNNIFSSPDDSRNKFNRFLNNYLRNTSNFFRTSVFSFKKGILQKVVDLPNGKLSHDSKTILSQQWHHLAPDSLESKVYKQQKPMRKQLAIFDNALKGLITWSS